MKNFFLFCDTFNISIHCNAYFSTHLELIWTNLNIRRLKKTCFLMKSTCIIILKQTNLSSLGYVPCKIMQDKYCYSYGDIYTVSVKISFQTYCLFNEKLRENIYSFLCFKVIDLIRKMNEDC